MRAAGSNRGKLWNHINNIGRIAILDGPGFLEGNFQPAFPAQNKVAASKEHGGNHNDQNKITNVERLLSESNLVVSLRIINQVSGRYDRRRDCGGSGCGNSGGCCSRLDSCRNRGSGSVADGDSPRGGIDLGFGWIISGMTALASGDNVLQRIDHASMGSSLVGGLVVAGMAQIAEIAECV